MKYLSVIIGLTGGTYLYQSITDKNWGLAATVTFFQILAVIACAIADWSEN